MDWSRFIPYNFEYDWESNKLAEHGVRFEEAVETFSITMKSEGINGSPIDTNSLAGQTEAGG